MADSNGKPAGGFNIGRVQHREALDKNRKWVHIISPDGHLTWVGGDSDENGKIADNANPGDAKPARVCVASTESSLFLDRTFEITRRVREDGAPDTGSGVRDLGLERIAAAIVDFENFVDPDGKPLDAGNAEHRLMFVTANDAYAKQVAEASESRNDFLGEGSGS